MSFDTTSTFTTLHLNLDNYFPFFLKDLESNQDLEIFSNSFKLAFQHMLHLSTNGLFGMVFEHLRIVFTQKIQQMDSLNYFNFVLILLKVTIHLELHMSLVRPTF